MTEEPDKGMEMAPGSGMLLALFGVPFFGGMLLQFMLAPEVPAPAFYDTLGFVVGTVAAVTYAIVKWRLWEQISRYFR